MRVLIVSHHALPHVGGLEVLVDYEIRALIAAGHEVTLVTSNGTGNAQTPAYPPSVRVLRVPASHFLERRFRLPYPLFGPKLVRVLWKEIGRADVVHIHGFMFQTSVVAALLSRLRRRHLILTDHGGIQQFDSRLKSILARIGAETAGRLTACCANQLVAYNTRINRLLERLTGRDDSLFLPNPVDGRLFHPLSPGERSRVREELGWTDHPKVLYVGRLITEKGAPLLAECVSADYDLVFCGSGDPSILGALPRPGIEYLPPRPQAELVKLYQAADLLVVPSKVREGFPLVVQEALACGLPVVLGEDEGFGPYRVLPGLTFCQPTREGVRDAIASAFAKAYIESTVESLAEFCPEPAIWIRRLYSPVPSSTEASGATV
jgi:D-inositol-3-phosphate glycosyltransferase